jgi:tRNA pseudouridine38-40 synthase
MEYDGTGYHGFQWQAGLPSIQGEVEKALLKLTGERRRVMAASRTDAGVHAKEQVVSFRTGSSLPTHNFVHGLNHYLPADIAVKAAYRVDDSFNVRRDALSREYSYYILNSPTRSPLREGFSYLVGSPLDVEAMNRASQVLIGEHDFASFASLNGAELKSTVRRVFRAKIERDEELVIFNMVANSFLLHQVRNTVGALIRVGLGKVSVDEFHNMVEVRKPGLAGPTAPACGLCLTRIDYPRSLERCNEDL